MIHFLEVPMQHVGPAASTAYHRCSRGDACRGAHAPAALGWTLHERDDLASQPFWSAWEYPFVPADADPLDTSAWVCEDCACWIEDMHALRELFVGLP